MIKKLVRHGNSLALVIDKPILELLKIDADTPLEIATDGRSLVVHPTGKAYLNRVSESGRRMMRIHDDTFRKLAK
jgi:antitoxin component of MazEF toxin-antitoxin module